ncbi:hypothetical protein E3N88_40580 [Mikania micrantha]|uniref:Gnk2-homologous domain-containing protein n=1 Tax=Mikania micrantha TaxID=192012 RepID=A0A5N6LMZ8_9ASTR|nr:hypothetical protein E3N88_40580 [Mikania micrantha]
MKQAFYLSFPLIIPFLSVFAKESIVYFECSQLYYTSTTTYESNVNSLFTSLVSSASVSNFNKFEISPQNDVVYGLFQCRGDLSFLECKDCVENSVNQLKETCPKSTSGTIQLEGCFVKYDNTSFFGVVDNMKVFMRCGPSIGYNSNILTQIDDALTYLVGGTGQYFRVGVLGSVQGMMQCVQDLNASDCEDCVLEARGRVRSECQTSTWGDMYLGKCYIRYADGSFRPIKGIDVNINDDLRGGTKKGKNVKQVFGIVVMINRTMSRTTLAELQSCRRPTATIDRTQLRSGAAGDCRRVTVKKEVTIVRQRAEEAVEAAKQEAKEAKREARVAREESELHKSQIETLSRQRDWYKSMSTR